MSAVEHSLDIKSAGPNPSFAHQCFWWEPRAPIAWQ